MECSKVDIRPVIKHITDIENKRPEEKFQNETLRPILKMQHALLRAVFNENAAKNKVDVGALNSEKRVELVTRTFKQDHMFKTEVRGLIIGHFTMEEYVTYAGMKTEINRRILTMSAERVLSGL